MGGSTMQGGLSNQPHATEYTLQGRSSASFSPLLFSFSSIFFIGTYRLLVTAWYRLSQLTLSRFAI